MEKTTLIPLDKAARLVGGRGALALLLGIKISAIGNWKVRGVPLEHCVPIERATHGAVTRRDLRPDDWANIWPELEAQSEQPWDGITERRKLNAPIDRRVSPESVARADFLRRQIDIGAAGQGV